MLKNTITSYGSVSKWLHWLIFVLVVCMLVLGVSMGSISNKAIQAEAYDLHKLTGLTILVLMVVRLVWALINQKPVLPSDVEPWQRIAEHIVHGLFYFVLIAMPISGWVMSVASGHPPSFFGLFDFSLPIAQSKTLANIADSTHEALAILLVVLICGHIFAALYHHVIKKDDILKRMLPEHLY